MSSRVSRLTKVWSSSLNDSSAVVITPSATASATCPQYAIAPAKMTTTPATSVVMPMLPPLDVW